jgi:hypothetical protein
MRKIFSIFLILTSTLVFGQQLSSQSKVSLITIAPGEELYSSFGHSAIRITDPVNALDQSFNYGSFDFNASNFYLRFLRGTLPYQISTHEFYREFEYYTYQENRGIEEQVLNLTLEQKQKVYDFLINNLLPQNKEYAYKFFYDNCSTRLRDVFKTACGDSLKFDQQIHPDSSFREWIDVYANSGKLYWSDFGMDLAIGIPSDRKTGWKDAMFLPDNLRDAFGAAKIYKNGQWVPVVTSLTKLNQPNPAKTESPLPKPINLFLGLLIFGIAYTAFQYFRVNKSNVFDYIFFTILGVSGWILFLLWFFTNHGVTNYNMNMLWAFPLLLPFIFSRKLQKNIRIFHTITSSICIVGYWFLPQQLHPAVLPICILIIIRHLFYLKNNKA